MDPSGIAAFVLGVLATLLGIGMVVRSLVSASRRGQKVMGRFWAPADMFLAHELADNRRGFWLCVAGLAVSAAALYILA